MRAVLKLFKNSLLTNALKISVNTALCYFGMGLRFNNMGGVFVIVSLNPRAQPINVLYHQELVQLQLQIWLVLIVYIVQI